MKLYKYLLVFLGFYFFFLLFALPADILWTHLGEKRVAAVRPSLVGGSWLHGRVRGVTTPLVDMDTFAWDLAPLALVSGRLRAEFTAGAVGGKVGGTITLSPGRVGFSRVSGRLPAAGIKSAFTLGGEFVFEKVKMVLVNGRVKSAAGDMIWRSAGFGPYSALGDLRVSLGSGDGGINARIMGENGLDLAAELRLLPDGRVRIRGTARPVSPDQTAIFALVGKTGPDGRVKIDYRARLPRAWSVGPKNR